MTTLPNLHDGFFDGVWLSPDKQTRFFVRTVAGERSTIILTGVEALNICGLRAGNIIVDLVFITSDKLTVKDIEQAYGLKGGKPRRRSNSSAKCRSRAFPGLKSTLRMGPKVRGYFGL